MANARRREPMTLPGWPRGMREDLAAEYVGLSAGTLRALVNKGELRETWVSRGRKVYLRDHLDAYLDRKAGGPDHFNPQGDATDPAAEWDAALDVTGGPPLP